jgi:hypothetical protein
VAFLTNQCCARSGFTIPGIRVTLGYKVFQTCFHPFSMMTCISLIEQKPPISVLPVAFVHAEILFCTSCSFHQPDVNHLCSLFCQVAL